MSIDIHDLQREQQELKEKAEKLAQLEQESGELSEEQLEEFDDIQAKFSAVTAKIQRQEKIQAMQAATARPLNANGTGHQMQTTTLPNLAATSTVKGAKVARMVQAVVAVGRGGREAAHYAETVLGDTEVAAVLGTQSATAGGVLVPQGFVDEIIEVLTPKAVVRSMNPKILPMPNGNLAIPALRGGATAYYTEENQDVKSSTQETGDVKLVAKQLTALVPMSNQLINFSGVSEAVDRFIIGDMTQQMAAREDKAFMVGDGTSNTPKGFDSICLPDFKIAAAGGATVKEVEADLTKLELKLAISNVPMLSVGWLMDVTTELFLKGLRSDLGVLIFPEMANGMLRGKPYKATTQLDVRMIFLVNFNDVVIGDALVDSENQLSIAVSNEAVYKDSTGQMVSAFSRNQTVIRVTSHHDIGIRHNESIAILTDIEWA